MPSARLPDDGDVNAELPEDLEDLIAETENDDLEYDVSVIPDLGADEMDLDRLRGILRRGQGEPNPSSDIASASATGRASRPPTASHSEPTHFRYRCEDADIITDLSVPISLGKGDFATSRQRIRAAYA
ncbi:hypothetical protein E4U58_000976 [Claviceps cyperi]|nr:hypothetical protein E4U58_000976 [Claviceps cyperi]